jgi:hypothetical protein
MALGSALAAASQAPGAGLYSAADPGLGRGLLWMSPAILSSSPANLASCCVPLLALPDDVQRSCHRVGDLGEHRPFGLAVEAAVRPRPEPGETSQTRVKTVRPHPAIGGKRSGSLIVPSRLALSAAATPIAAPAQLPGLAASSCPPTY